MSIKIYGQKAIVPFASGIAGGLIVLAALRVSPQLRVLVTPPMPKTTVQELNSDVADSADPFQMMRRMQKRMESLSRFQNQNPLDSFFSDQTAGGIGSLSEREDDNSVYYDINVDDLEHTSINTKIEQGYITITGTIEKKSGGDAAFKSTFNRTFPVPDQVDANKMEMLNDKNKIILKFPKAKV